MGVVNLTPDSFSDGGQFVDSQVAIQHAFKLIKDGADIVDLGAESTRPGAEPLHPDEELARLVPVLEAIQDAGVAVSVDTRHAETMRAVLRYSVDLINDVNGFRAPGAVEAVSGSSAGVCVMHMAGDPLTMQEDPAYRSVVSEVAGFLHDRVDVLRSSGVSANRLIVDPGIGFGKKLAHNLELLGSIRQISVTTDCPVLIGLSRKSMLGEMTGRPVDERLAASIGGALAAVQNGASILRVHDVAQTRDALTVFTRMTA
ncbi:MAG: dihydropteroate synthase [Burkholderiaceae bacterium]